MGERGKPPFFSAKTIAQNETEFCAMPPLRKMVILRGRRKPYRTIAGAEKNGRIEEQSPRSSAGFFHAQKEVRR